MAEPLDLAPILRRREQFGDVFADELHGEGLDWSDYADGIAEFYDHAPADVDALSAELVRLRVDNSQPAPSLADAPCYATARTPCGDVYVNLAIGVRGGLPWFWADCPMPGEYPWKSTAELEALGAVVVSVPHGVT